MSGAYQWRVVWFPDDVAERSSSATFDETRARETFAKAKDYAPILQRRFVEDWEDFENPTYDDHKSTDSEDQR